MDSGFRIYLSDPGGAKEIRTLDLLHAIPDEPSGRVDLVGYAQVKQDGQSDCIRLCPKPSACVVTWLVTSLGTSPQDESPRKQEPAAACLVAGNSPNRKCLAVKRYWLSTPSELVVDHLRLAGITPRGVVADCATPSGPRRTQAPSGSGPATARSSGPAAANGGRAGSADVGKMLRSARRGAVRRSAGTDIVRTGSRPGTWNHG